MFYSHDLLTSREHGVATIWLVATLGSKSNLKKVSRKAILDVNVKKACEIVLTPQAPLALRLQSNLLYGITRVYSQQCGYVLNDVESARNNMRALFNAVQVAGLEPEGAHQARTEQLTLQSDPNFLPGLDLVLTDFDGFVSGAPVVGYSQQSFLSPHSTQASSTSSRDIGGIIIPPSQSPSLGRSTSRAETSRFPEEFQAGRELGSAQLLDDDLGLIIEPAESFRPADLSPSQLRGMSGEAQSDVVAGGPDPIYNFDDTAPQAGEADYFVLQDDSVPASDPADALFPLPTQANSQQETTSETVQAPLHRRKRVPKQMPPDNITELHTSDLARWSANYLADMKKATRAKESVRLSAIAKSNAMFWVLGPTTGHQSGGPLDMFTGVQLLEAFSGLQLHSGGQKRRYEDDTVVTPEVRRVRSRDEVPEGEIGRGANENLYPDDGFIVPMDDDAIEQGRNAPTPLDDGYLSTVFPWSTSAGSRRPSNIPSSGSLAAAASRRLSTMGRRGSRMPSASPLLGRGTLGGDEMDDVQYQDLGFPSSNDDGFEMFGGIAQDTQITAQSEWQRSLVDGDGMNFLAFVQNFIDDANLARQSRATSERAAGEEATDEEGREESVVDSVEFETLLPPAETTAAVAAHGLMHVLALGTMGRLNVQQTETETEPFGPIVLHVNTIENVVT